MVIAIKQVEYLNIYKLKLFFTDGKENTIVFEPFLKNTKNPMTTKYLDTNKFSNFSIWWRKMLLKRRRFESGGLGWQGSSGLPAGFARRFSPLQPVGFIVVHRFLRRGGSSSDHPVGQSKECVELMPVLGQAAIPHFPMAE